MKNRIPTFSTGRLILRDIDESDIPSYQSYFSNYEVIRNLAASVPWPFPEDGVESFLNSLVFPEQGKTVWLWGIFEKSFPDKLIGCVHLWREGKPEYRGFWLAEPFWGKGYMTEAVTPVMDYAFDVLGLEKLVFAHATGNLRSRRVKEKTGAKFLRAETAKFVDPTLTEHEIWELEKGNWQAFKKKAD